MTTRSIAELDKIPVSEWTDDEGFLHLKDTFETQSKQHQDALEPYIVLLESADHKEDQKEIMRRGLRETFSKRYPHYVRC